MLGMPKPVAEEKSEETISDGDSDATALELPKDFSADEVEAFMEFIFSTQLWTDETRPLLGLTAVLRLSHFFDAASGVKYAVHHLENHPLLVPALRFRLAQNFDVTHWIEHAFEELMSHSILDLTESDEDLIDHRAYRALVRAHTELTLCERCWNEVWMDSTGMLGALLRDEMSGAELHDMLPELDVPGMTGECRIRTVASIQDRPADGEVPERPSQLKEDRIIADAIAALM
ncbi:hypothetical protein C8J57DRAFT_1232598 [Mycena rebaudengoi]|nr:hypothetical protein C8J57DRAFT_1232598 [Mycena rebaudengoi]